MIKWAIFSDISLQGRQSQQWLKIWARDVGEPPLVRAWTWGSCQGSWTRGVWPPPRCWYSDARPAHWSRSAGQSRRGCLHRACHRGGPPGSRLWDRPPCIVCSGSTLAGRTPGCPGTESRPGAGGQAGLGTNCSTQSLSAWPARTGDLSAHFHPERENREIIFVFLFVKNVGNQPWYHRVKLV